MKFIRRLSLSLFSKYLIAFCLISLASIIFGAISVHALFDEFEEASELRSEFSEDIAFELAEYLLPLNKELSKTRTLLSEFSTEMSLLSIDANRTFDRLERIVIELESARSKLAPAWPVGVLETSLLERLTSNIIISEDIANEVLELRDPNYTYQLHEESIEIIEQLIQDSEFVLNAVSQKLVSLAKSSLEAANISSIQTQKAHEQLNRNSILFIVGAAILLGAIVWFIRVFSHEARRRLWLLQSFANGVEEGYYDQSIPLDVSDESGRLARSLESMSRRLVSLIQESEDLALKADESSRAKSEFLATMSHEIRTPMNGVIGLLDVLASQPMDAQQKHYIGLAQSSANSLLALLNDILDFSKIESGKLELENVQFDVLELIGDFIDVASLAAGERGLVLLFDSPQIDNGWIMGDPARIRQILTNLVGNALKFTHEGEIDIYVDLYQRDEGSWLYIEVKDQGIGIPESSMAALFDSFTQVDASTTRKYGGTGLGLTITNQLVQLMGGEGLHVESVEGKGSRFYFEIPAIQVLPQNVSTDSASSSTAPKQGPLLANKKKRALLVEDNAVNQVVAQALIESNGYEVVIANNGQEALDTLKLHQDIVVVFMDCQMPVMDGYTATSEIRKGVAGDQYKEVTIIAMTANAMQGDREKCIDAGMTGYIAKPIDADLLSQTLSETVSQA